MHTTHSCGTCGRYTAVVLHGDGKHWAHDFLNDGHTPSAAVHTCGTELSR